MEQGNSVGVIKRDRNKGKWAIKAGAKKSKFKSRDWILQKKERAVKQGKKVKMIRSIPEESAPLDSKFFSRNKIVTIIVHT